MPDLPVPVVTIGLLIASNLFMTFAWYGHLKFKALPLYAAILISWGIAPSATATSTPPSSRPSRR